MFLDVKRNYLAPRWRYKPAPSLEV